MTKASNHIITTAELDHEEWLLAIVDCELATLRQRAYEDLIPELSHVAGELTELAWGNQARVRLLTHLRAKLIASLSKRSHVPYKKVQHLGGTA